MKINHILLMLMLLLLSISVVSASENISDIGNGSSDIILESADDISDVGDGNDSSVIVDDESDVVSEINNTSESIENVENTSDDNESVKLTYVLSGSDVTGYVSSNVKYSFKLTDNMGNPISKESVRLKINGKYYNSVTDDNGKGFLILKLNAGKYTVTASYKNVSASNQIKVLSYKITAKNILSAYGTKVKYTVTVRDSENNPVSGRSVKITIGKKVYQRSSNSKGVATLTLNYASGKYKIHYSVCGKSGSNTYKVNNKITLKILDWGLKGDVSKVQPIKNNMPNSKWVKKAVAATKKGIPLLTFKGGPGKVVFITAGVHGNELSSQVAAMKLIKYMTDNPIKGTVYIIPFVNVKAISHKVRFTNSDFNRIAHKSGTIPNKIVKMVVKFKCDSYGDFHTTQPGGVPGKNVVMGSKAPNLISYKITNYIVKKCNVNRIVYNYAGEKYPGAIADNVNKANIPSVLCEVMLPHNTVTTKTVNLSLSMMKCLLKYNSVI